MLETHTADSKLAETSQEQFMSADKISNDTTNTDSKRRPSALMKVANTIDTSVDSSLDAFIAEANSTLDSIAGWGISDDAAGVVTNEISQAESRASAAEKRVELIERQTQYALTSAQSQLAEAEARVAAAEQRAARAEKTAKNAKTNLLASAVPRQNATRPSVAQLPIPEIAPVAPTPVVAAPAVALEAFPDTIDEFTKSKPKYALFACVFIAGGLIAFGAAKLMVGNSDSSTAATPEAPAMVATPDEAEAAPTPDVAAPAVEAMPAVKSLAADPETEVAPEVVPLDSRNEEAEHAAAAAEAERLAQEAASAQATAQALAQEQALAAQEAADKAATAAQIAADNAAAAAKAAKENAAAVSAGSKPAATAPKRTKKATKKSKPAKDKSKSKTKSPKAPEKPKGGIVDPFA